ncbi:MAG TPA: DEAD/DEAH box helicase [Actinomycetota bacterium]|nr:DEAD/DEAH box helicase [Actinomycetota bacterium]
MEAGTFVEELMSREDYEGQVAVRRTLPPREAVFGTLSAQLHPQVASALDAAGILRLYSHQAQAIDRLLRGRHTIVATGTASGKTLCYHVPAFEAALSGGTVLYLCPTKALAQDQLRQVARFGLPQVVADIYDGDTPSHVRGAIRREANLVLTNPDMLHVGILPNHARWMRFLRSLRLVVIDEAHVLRGIFGSHVALVLRRLRRLARHMGAEPVFALASATIGNPGQHASALTGLEVGEVTGDGAPAGERHFIFWNPPLDESKDGRRRSSNFEAAVLLSELVAHGAKSLAFSKSRIAAELVARYASDRLPDHVSPAIAAYRAGYLSSERRDIEQGLQEGRYVGVSATNALELGVDIGHLDGVVLNGFPGTVASARQQAGRAGRAGQTSVAFVVPQDEPLDQFYVQHSDQFFSKPHEAALVNPDNPHVLRPHLGCAAYERPLDPHDVDLFGPACDEVGASMVESGELRERRDRLFWSAGRPPAPDVDIRAAGGRPYRIVESTTGRLVGSVDSARAFTDTHPGAVYLHQGETYRVTQLVPEDRVALVSPAPRNEYTQARVDHDLEVLSVDRSSTLGDAGLYTGSVRVTDRVTGYQRKRLPDGEVIEIADLELPPQTLVTRSVWYTIPESRLLDCLEPIRPDLEVALSSLHAAEHACIGLLPVFAMCDRWDIGGLSTYLHADTGLPTIFLYDGYPGGAGITDHAFAVAAEHVGATRDHVSHCPCATGCPSCVQSPKCGNWNQYLNKPGAVLVLSLLATGVTADTAP